MESDMNIPYSQSQSYPQHQQTAYESQQQTHWNSVDLAPNTAPFANYAPNARNPEGCDDATTVLQHNEQDVPSPIYSQYLDFESMDTQALTNTSSTLSASFQQYTEFPLKQEAGSEPDGLSLPQWTSIGQATQSLPRPSAPLPAGSGSFENPDMEMEDFNLGDWFPSSTTSPTDLQPTSRPSNTTSYTASVSASRKPSTDDEKTKNTRKHRKRTRKPSLADDNDEAQTRAKQAHSIVERRYRDNLNGKIMQLHRTLSSVSSNSNRSNSSTLYVGEDNQEQPGSSSSARVRKSDVMTDAMNYIHQSEISMRHMTDEIARLNERVRTLERLVRCEECIVLREMVRRSLQSQQSQHGQQPQQPQPQQQQQQHG